MSIGLRLERQHLARPAERGALVEVARRLGGLHAQVLSAADLQLRARIRGHTRGELERALWEERTVVKTWLMRGTLHVVPADDLPLYVGALDNRGEYAGAWLRAFGVTARDMERLVAAIADALAGGSLTREELIAAVAPRVGKAASARLRSGWGEFLKPASRRGVLCFGPNRGKNVTFVRPDQWLGGWRELPRAEARTELLRRFLGVHGPATPADYEHWLGVSRRVKEPWEALRDELVEVEPTRFVLAEHAAALGKRARGVRLLGMFDPYVLFPRSDRPVPPEHLARVYRQSGWISAVVLERGRVIGVWSHEVRGRRVHVAVEPFGAIAAPTRAVVAREAASVARHLGGDLELAWA